MADFSKIGRNNKNRGRAFERQVAEKLGWTRVPYSGAMKEWGGADVVDGFYTRNGLWAAECKTQQPGDSWSISIKAKWVKQMYGGEQDGRHGIIITKNVGQKKVAAGSEAFVFMLDDTYDWFMDQVPARYRPVKSQCSTYTRGIGHNFVVEAEWLSHCKNGIVLEVGVRDKKADNITIWRILSLDKFAQLVQANNLYVPEVKPNE